MFCAVLVLKERQKVKLGNDYINRTDCLFCSSVIYNLIHVYKTDLCRKLNFHQLNITLNANLESLRNLFTATAGHWL